MCNVMSNFQTVSRGYLSRSRLTKQKVSEVCYVWHTDVNIAYYSSFLPWLRSKLLYTIQYVTDMSYCVRCGRCTRWPLSAAWTCPELEPCQLSMCGCTTWLCLSELLLDTWQACLNGLARREVVWATADVINSRVYVGLARAGSCVRAVWWGRRPWERCINPGRSCGRSDGDGVR